MSETKTDTPVIGDTAPFRSATEEFSENLPASDKSRYWEKHRVTGRGLEEYLRFMHLTREDLRDKKVLDVGAGAANFARDVQAENLGTTVVSLDPSYVLDADTRASKRSVAIGWRGEIEADPPNSVAGIAEQTPFADASFDMVLASFSVPEYFPLQDMRDYQNRFLKTLEEFDRILKVNGEIRIYPSGVLMEINSVDDTYDELPYEEAAMKSFLETHNYATQSIKLDNQKDEWRAVLVLRKLEFPDQPST